MATLYTRLAVSSTSAITVYDSFDDDNSASLLQHKDSLEAYWVDSLGNKYLVWKKPDKTIDYIYYGGLTSHEMSNYKPE